MKLTNFGDIMHIAITGNLGSGKSTVAAILAERLGFETYSTGSVQRQAAADLGISTLELNERMMTDPSLDHIIDDTVTKISLERDHIIFDSRMAWHFAKNAFRVFITVDIDEAAKRVYNAGRGSVESYASVADAKSALEKRAALERERFLDIYGVDYNDMSNYDCVVDSTTSTPEFTAEKIIASFQKAAEK